MLLEIQGRRCTIADVLLYTVCQLHFTLYISRQGPPSDLHWADIICGVDHFQHSSDTGVVLWVCVALGRVYKVQHWCLVPVILLLLLFFKQLSLTAVLSKIQNQKYPAKAVLWP